MTTFSKFVFLVFSLFQDSFLSPGVDLIRIKVQIQMTKNDVIIQILHLERSLKMQILKFRRRSADF